MTKVQIHFRLERPLDDALMTRIAGVSSIYGIQKVTVAPSLDGLTVEYDATRLRLAEVNPLLRAPAFPSPQNSDRRARASISEEFDVQRRRFAPLQLSEI